VRLVRHKALEIVVLSVGGKSEGVVAALRALDVNDYKFVCAKVDEITDGLPAEKKSGSETSTAPSSETAKVESAS
jgi:hypothetical protein